MVLEQSVRHPSLRLLLNRGRSHGPWINDFYAPAFEIPDVSSGQGQVMGFGCGHDQAVHRGEPSTASLCKRHEISPDQGNCAIYWGHAAFKALWQIMRKPFFKSVAPSPRIHQRDTAAYLSNRYNTDKYAVFIQSMKPRYYTFIRARFCDLRQDVGIEEQPHSGKSRGSSVCLSILRAAPRKGDASRNSASDPLRAVFFCHSSAETITTLGVPLRVMVCGANWARSMTSDSFAFAAATVQLSGTGVCITTTYDHHDHYDHYDYNGWVAFMQSEVQG